MAKILDMPKLSPTMEEGLLTVWHKNEGDSVEVDDLLAEVETDKATMEFRSFDKGVLLKRLVEAGAEVKLGQPVAILGQAGEDVSALVASAGSAPAAKAPAQEKPQEKAPEPTAEKAPAPNDAEKKAPEPSVHNTPMEPKGDLLTRTERTRTPRPAEGSVLASPYVRKLAREQGVTLAGKRGSGPHGRVVPQDLDSLQSASSSPETALARTAASVRADRAEHKPLSPMRKTIARRLTESKQNVPHFYLSIDVDVRKLVAFRETVNEELARGFKPTGDPSVKPTKVSVNDFLIKACALALARVPACNATFTPEALIFHQRVDISVAVAVPDGLVTPVVRDADKKSLVAIAGEVRELAARARSKKLAPEEMADGTFSISNLGMFGIDNFSAVINPPEGAILAVGQVREVPIVDDGQLAPGKQLAMTLSCDHRVVDGAVGAAFLAELRALLEQPLRIVSG